MSQPKLLTSPWRLSLDSLSSWRKHIKTLILVTAVVTVPANLLQLLLSSGDTTISSYISLAAVLMNLALIWAIIRLDDGNKVSMRQAYYQGTAGFVRFLLVSLILVVELIPLTLGLILYNVGVAGAAPGTAGFEQIAVTALAVLLATPSLFWFNRSVLALVIVPGSELAPVAAVRQSWQRVKGRSWQVLGRLLSLVVASTVLIIVPALGLVYLYERTTNRGFLALLQVFASLVVLPFINIYLYRLYKELV